MWKKCKGCGEMFFGSPCEDFCESCTDDIEYEFRAPTSKTAINYTGENMSLFVCPDCGYAELPIWKSCHWRRYSLYTNFTELEVFLPELAKKLEPGAWLLEKPYWYKRNRKGNIVYRMTEMGKDEFRTHGFTEKRKPAPDKTQTVLVEAQPVFNACFSAKEKMTKT